ncbi:MAG: excinuclease ABC subunit UvrC [Crocinitomicaceae bacterium]|nr:excinuclease ABC subunit UvrC [Crocinitomicaceae bacterium]
MISKDQLADKVNTLPHNPGVYQFLDQNGSIIYVGKAIDLKKRVSSYFQKEHLDGKTRTLVKLICDLRFTVVQNELDALLLENNLIKSYKPRYNVLLKDDKTYPWIVIKNEAFPRIFPTRRKFNDGSTYYGPYPNVKQMHQLLALIRELFQIRTCALDLRTQKLEQRKYKVCLEYHIGKCAGPCENLQTQSAYNQTLQAIRLLLEGKNFSLIQQLKKDMLAHASTQAFEAAQRCKELIDALGKYQAKSMMVSDHTQNFDVCYVEKAQPDAWLSYLVICEGSIVHAYTSKVSDPLDVPLETLYRQVIPQLRGHFESSSKEIVVGLNEPLLLADAKSLFPKIGEKKQLLEMAMNNVRHAQLQVRKAAMNKSTAVQNAPMQAVLELQSALGLSKPPLHIECFDNSNLQGTNPVSACVVFKNGAPSKADYRHFNVKTVVGPDDFSTMKEAVGRRYSRLKAEEQPLPDLIIIDGGKGQLSAALEAIEELGLQHELKLIGLAKRLEELYKPGFSRSLILDRRSLALKLVQQLRDEAHRFGLSHHRNRRSKTAVGSALDQVKGLGPKTIEALFHEFKSMAKMKAAEPELIAKKIGAAKAKLLFEFFKNDEGSLK